MPKRNPAVNPVKSLPLKGTLVQVKSSAGKESKTFGGAFGAKKGH